MAGPSGSLLVRLGLDAVDYYNGLSKAEQAAIRFSQAVSKSSTFKVQGGGDAVARQFNEASKAATQFGTSVTKGANQANEAMRSLESTARGVKATFGTVIAAFSAREVVLAADAWANMNARMSLVTTSSNDLRIVMQEVKRIASTTGQPIAEVGDLYFRLAQATQHLGIEQSRGIKLTEYLNKALVASGATGTSARDAMIQFGQAMASGKFTGAEFTSVNEQANVVIRELALGLGRTAGELRDLAHAGKLDPLTIFVGLERRFAAIDAMASKIPITVERAFTLLKNEFVEFIGTNALALGAIQKTADAINLLAKNLDVLAAVAGAAIVGKLASVFINVGKAAAAHVGGVVAATKAHTAQTAVLKSEVAMYEVLGAQKVRAARDAATDAHVNLASLARREAALLKVQAQLEQEARLAAAYAATNNVVIKSTKAQADLVKIGQELTSVNAQIVAGHNAVAKAHADLGAAQAKATAETTKARGAFVALGSTAARVGGGLLALFGGWPGLIITALSAGTLAWSLWAQRAKEANDGVAKSTERTTNDIITDIERQNEAIRSRLLMSGVPITDQTPPEAVKRATQLAREIRDMEASIGTTMPELGGQAIDEDIRRGIIEKWKQFYKLIAEIDEQAALKGDEALKKRQEARKAFLKAFETDNEKIEREIKEQQALMGDLFTLADEQRIRDKYAKKGSRSEINEAEAQARAIADGRLKALEDGLRHEQDLLKFRDTQLQAQFRDELIAYDQFYAERRDLIDQGLQKELEANKKKITELERLRAALSKESDQIEVGVRIADVQRDSARAAREAKQAVTQSFSEQARAAKAFADQVERVRISLLELSGDAVGATMADFDAQHKAYKDTIDLQKRSLDMTVRQNAELADVQLKALRDIVEVNARIAEQRERISEITEFGDIGKRRVELGRSKGEFGEIEALQKISDINRSMLGPMRERLALMQKTFDESTVKTPKMILELEQVKIQIEELEAATDLAGDRFRDIFADEFSSAFSDFISGTKSAKEAFKDFAKSVTKQINDIAAKTISDALFKGQGPLAGIGGWLGTIFGGGAKAATGAAGTAAAAAGVASMGSAAMAATAPLGLLAANASLAATAMAMVAGRSASSAAEDVFMSIADNIWGTSGDWGMYTRAGGGGVPANQPTWVGEAGPEVWVPQTAGKIIPAHETKRLMNSSVYHMPINVTVNGQMSRQTASQAAAELGLKIRRSIARDK